MDVRRFPMFPLKTATLPATAAALEPPPQRKPSQHCLSSTNDPVAIREASYPHLAELNVSLDGAQLRGQPPAIPSLSSDPTPALDVDSLKIAASALSIGPAAVDLSLAATAVSLHQAKDSQGNVAPPPAQRREWPHRNLHLAIRPRSPHCRGREDRSRQTRRHHRGRSIDFALAKLPLAGGRGSFAREETISERLHENHRPARSRRRTQRARLRP